jgi:hypothetical protein
MQIQGFLVLLFTILITFNSNAQKVDFSLDDLELVVQTSTNPISLGEEYSAEISFNQKIPETYKIGISVGGASLRIDREKARYTARGTSLGERRFTVKAVLKDAKGELIGNLEKEVSYTISLASIHVSADKMNVFYVGVDNPINILAPGIPVSVLGVKISGDIGRIRKVGRTNYVVTCERAGMLTIVVQNKKNGKTYPFQYRVKKIPEPTIRLGKLPDGEISAATFVEQPGLAAWLYNFDFEARCTIKQYKVLHYTKGKKMVEILNTGGRFEEATLTEIKKAKAGDMYIFTEVEGDCPRDTAGRSFNSLVFKIK